MIHSDISAILQQINQIIIGKQQPIKLALTCLLAKGHLLIEDVPGVGKTTLAHTLAATLGLTFQRIQFTSDMLPADIIGVSIFNRDKAEFTFHPGPIFTQLILADEVNRASPRTQSALLEAMEEQQVTIDNQTLDLSTPFFVIATQNPSHQLGTFELPESQLDRFLMRIEIGYPDAEAERALLSGENRRDLVKKLQAVITPQQLLDLQHQVSTVTVSSALLDYLQSILRYTRESGHFQHGLSPRAGLGLLSAAKAWASIDGRGHVVPEDVQAVLANVVSHRLVVKDEAHRHNWLETMIQAIPVP